MCQCGGPVRPCPAPHAVLCPWDPWNRHGSPSSPRTSFDSGRQRKGRFLVIVVLAFTVSKEGVAEAPA